MEKLDCFSVRCTKKKSIVETTRKFNKSFLSAECNFNFNSYYSYLFVVHKPIDFEFKLVSFSLVLKQYHFEAHFFQIIGVKREIKFKEVIPTYEEINFVKYLNFSAHRFNLKTRCVAMK